MRLTREEDGRRDGRHSIGECARHPVDGDRLSVAVGVKLGVKIVLELLKINCMCSELVKHGAPSGTRTPNPLIKGHSRAVFGCLATSLTCCDVFAPVCQRVPWAGDVGVNRRCQNPPARLSASARIRGCLSWSPVCWRLSGSVADALWVSGSRPASPQICIPQCAPGRGVTQDLVGGHVGRWM